MGSVEREASSRRLSRGSLANDLPPSLSTSSSFRPSPKQLLHLPPHQPVVHRRQHLPPPSTTPPLTTLPPPPRKLPVRRLVDSLLERPTPTRLPCRLCLGWAAQEVSRPSSQQSAPRRTRTSRPAHRRRRTMARRQTPDLVQDWVSPPPFISLFVPLLTPRVSRETDGADTGKETAPSRRQAQVHGSARQQARHPRRPSRSSPTRRKC